MSGTAPFTPLTNEKRHFLPPDGGESPSQDNFHKADIDNDEMDLSLWESKPNTEEQAKTVFLAFDNETYNGNDVPEIKVSEDPEPTSNEQVPAPDDFPAPDRQEEAVNDMIDILVHPGS